MARYKSNRKRPSNDACEVEPSTTRPKSDNVSDSSQSPNASFVGAPLVCRSSAAIGDKAGQAINNVTSPSLRWHSVPQRGRPPKLCNQVSGREGEKVRTCRTNWVRKYRKTRKTRPSFVLPSRKIHGTQVAQCGSGYVLLHIIRLTMRTAAV